MLSSLSTSNRRRGLRGAARKGSREQLPASSGDSSVSIRSASSSSSHTASRMSHASSATSRSIASSATSFSLASSSSADQCTPQHTASLSRSMHDFPPIPGPETTYPPPPTPSLSPIELLRLRLTDGKHVRKQSSASFSAPTAPVRVVGRGGQGSRPRALPAHPNGNAVPPPTKPPLLPSQTEPRRTAPTSSPANRIVGRGGVGSRPRGLALDPTPPLQRPDVPTPPLPAPPRPVALIQEAPRPALVYRPSGRGGAGSRPRKVKVKPPREQNGGPSAGMDFKFPWKGKGKARADAHADILDITANANANPLTRTDTTDSVGSASMIMFAPPSIHSRQRVVSPDLDAFDYTGGQTDTPPHSPTASLYSMQSAMTTSSDGRHQAQVVEARRMDKLARTLGAEVAFPGTSMSVSVPTPAHHAHMDRQSSYGSSFSSNSISSFPTPSSIPSPLEYAAPPQRPPRVFPTDSAFPADPYAKFPVFPTHPLPHSVDHEADLESDDASEILAFSTFSADEPPATQERFSYRSQSSGEIHVQPRFSLSSGESYAHSAELYAQDEYDPNEFDVEYVRANAQTPTPADRGDDGQGDEEEVEVGEVRFADPDDEKRFASPFQVMPLFVVPPWEPRPVTPAHLREGEQQHGWTGEWNRKDMQSVIQSLRHLKM
ncbi:hypothetical protein C8R44DRAFT_817644 [Mycena epipterygia]|nr:hypothetical protein C8R44DRAFT_817644 [Mycena epipterygia]